MTKSQSINENNFEYPSFTTQISVFYEKEFYIFPRLLLSKSLLNIMFFVYYILTRNNVKNSSSLWSLIKKVLIIG